MGRIELFRATLAQYRRHGWQLARALMTADSLAELRGEGADGATAAAALFEGVEPRESAFDAMWFRRPAADGREAWELRLAAEPYALFELFEPDEDEEDREDVRREMEAKVLERMGGSERAVSSER
jgi:hypothetical protein